MEMNPKDMEDFQKVVMAGMKIMYGKETFNIFASGMRKKDIPLPKRLAMESAGLMKMLFEKSGGKIPPQIIAPAAAMLLMEMGKFMKEAGVESPSSDQMREATGLLMGLLKQLFAKSRPGSSGQAMDGPQTDQPMQPPPPGGLISQARAM